MKAPSSAHQGCSAATVLLAVRSRIDSSGFGREVSCSEILRAKHAYEDARCGFEKKLSVHGEPTFLVFFLLALYVDKPVSVSVIAKHSCLSSSSVSRALRLLEEEGIVRTVVDPRDRRRILAQLTPRGLHEAKPVLESESDSIRLIMAIEIAARAEGLTGVQYMVLLIVSEMGEADVSEVARMCSVPRSTASLALRNLEAMGIVERISLEDARKSGYKVIGLDNSLS